MLLTGRCAIFRVPLGEITSEFVFKIPIKSDSVMGYQLGDMLRAKQLVR